MLMCHSLRHLNLWDNDISADGAGRLAGVLEHLPSVAYLSLWDNHIGDEGAGRLALGLRHCTSLDHLDLRNINMRVEGASKLAEGLGARTSLTYLTLDGYDNKILTAGVKMFSKALEGLPSLTHLDLNSKFIGAEGAGFLVAALQQVTSVAYLGLGWNKMERKVQPG